MKALGFGAMALLPVVVILVLRYGRLRGAMGSRARRSFALQSLIFVGAGLVACSLLSAYSGSLALPLAGQLALPIASVALILSLIRRS